MIVQLRGTLVEKSYDRVVVDVGGVGYGVVVSLQTLAELPAAGREVTLKTHLQIREDAHVLFGFGSDEERRAFELCISISGVGPKLAIAILSAQRPGEFADAVRRGDIARLTKTPGIGKKTAERIVVELKDRVDKAGLGSAATSQAGAPPAAVAGTRVEGIAGTVSSALVNLGYRADESERAAREATKGRDSIPLEQALREALRILTG